MTYQEAYRYGSQSLQQAGVEEYQLDAFYLLEHCTGITRASYYSNQYQEIAESSQKEYQKLIEQRAQRIPLQHLTGSQEFMGLTFEVNSDVLIPRQDTEVLVETALELLKNRAIDNASRDADKQQEAEALLTNNEWLLDMCTGSGCILISLLHYATQQNIKLSGTGVDVSPAALTIARKNAQANAVEATFIESDLFSRLQGRFSLIVSNPPYIPSAEIATLAPEVAQHDPLLALDGHEDGLYFYRKIVTDSSKYLLQDGWLLFEIGAPQAADVKALMESSGFKRVQIRKDLTGLDRVVFGQWR